eukprot:gene13257-biopygen5015
MPSTCCPHDVHMTRSEAGRNGRGRVPDASHTMGFEETDASRARPQPFLPDGGGGSAPQMGEEGEVLTNPGAHAHSM